MAKSVYDKMYNGDDWQEYCNFVDEHVAFKCLEASILELWNFDEKVISNLTEQDILDRLNNYNATR